jgi:putative transposase
MLFVDDVDRAGFFRALARVVAECGWLCHAYCLMENHYHLAVETPKPNLAVGMGRLNSAHAQGFNARHSRVGHVFQGRYHAVLVEKEPHLLEVCRYVVLNPVRAGLCAAPSQWRASSFRATAGLAQRPPFLTTAWVLAQFGGTRHRAQERYRTFVAEGLDDRPWDNVRGQIYLGGEELLVAIPRRTSQSPRSLERNGSRCGALSTSSSATTARRRSQSPIARRDTGCARLPSTWAFTSRRSADASGSWRHESGAGPGGSGLASTHRDPIGCLCPIARPDPRASWRPRLRISRAGFAGSQWR